MAISNSKSIAVRLPMDEYVRVISHAAEMKLSISEYLIFRLNSKPRVESKPQEAADLMIGQLSAQIRSLNEVNAQNVQTAEEWKRVAEKRARDTRAYTQALTLEQEKTKLLASDLETAIERKTMAEKNLYDLRGELTDIHNNSSLMGAMPERYWTVIDKFIPSEP